VSPVTPVYQKEYDKVTFLMNNVLQIEL